MNMKRGRWTSWLREGEREKLFNFSFHSTVFPLELRLYRPNVENWKVFFLLAFARRKKRQHRHTKKKSKRTHDSLSVCIKLRAELLRLQSEQSFHVELSFIDNTLFTCDLLLLLLEFPSPADMHQKHQTEDDDVSLRQRFVTLSC